MSYGLFLDDERNPDAVTWIDLPKIDWIIVRTVEDFKATITRLGRPTYVSFDNDLQTPLEGHNAAKFLCDTCLDHQWSLPQCFVHTRNTKGEAAIVSHLRSYVKAWPEFNM